MRFPDQETKPAGLDRFSSATVLAVTKEQYRPPRAAMRAVMFPSNGGMPGVSTERAEAVCDGCPVRAECREENRRLAPVHRYFGVWGGTSAKKRIEQRRSEA